MLREKIMKKDISFITFPLHFPNHINKPEKIKKKSSP